MTCSASQGRLFLNIIVRVRAIIIRHLQCGFKVFDKLLLLVNLFDVILQYGVDILIITLHSLFFLGHVDVVAFEKLLIIQHYIF